jgi:hypothetical protein
MSYEVVLSRRNILSLLHKLEMEGSERTIIKPNGMAVRVESDEAHYADRPCGAGPMHPETEEFVSDMMKALAIVRAQKLSGPTPQWARDAAEEIVDSLADDSEWDIEGRDRQRTIGSVAAEIIEKLSEAE